MAYNNMKIEVLYVKRLLKRKKNKIIYIFLYL